MRALVVVLLLAAAPAMAKPPRDVQRWSVLVDGGASWVRDPAFDGASRSDAAGRFGLALEHAPDWLDESLSLEAGYVAWGTSAQALQAFDTTLSSQALQLGARWHFAGIRGRSAYARGAFAFESNRLLLQGAGHELADRAWGAGFAAALGGELFSTKREGSTLTIGLVGELGWYQRFNDARFDSLSPVRSGEGDPSRLPFSGVDVGRIDLSGLFLRIGVGLRF
jgi:hypothetical protein